jgi:hypothetical protein
LLQCFYHFVKLPAILLLWTQPFFVECSNQPFFYNTKSFLQSCQPFFTVAEQLAILPLELSHFMILSVILL